MYGEPRGSARIHSQQSGLIDRESGQMYGVFRAYRDPRDFAKPLHGQTLP